MFFNVLLISVLRCHDTRSLNVKRFLHSTFLQKLKVWSDAKFLHFSLENFHAILFSTCMFIIWTNYYSTEEKKGSIWKDTGALIIVKCSFLHTKWNIYERLYLLCIKLLIHVLLALNRPLAKGHKYNTLCT